MSASGWAYIIFTAALALVMLGVIVYYFTPSRLDRIEEAKHRMLDEDDDNVKHD